MTRYATLYQRIVSLTAPPSSEQGCWTWRGLVKQRYPRLNIRTSDGRHKQIRAHRAMAVLMEIGEDVDLFWELYELYSIAKFEADHLCEGNPLCCAPDHLRMLDKEEHATETRRRGQGIHRKLRA